jgi:hypothetical protein
MNREGINVKMWSIIFEGGGENLNAAVSATTKKCVRLSGLRATWLLLYFFFHAALVFVNKCFLISAQFSLILPLFVAVIDARAEMFGPRPGCGSKICFSSSNDCY